MAINNASAVNRYASQVMDLRGFAENLQEFLESMPAPDENNTIPGPINYGHLGTLSEVHRLAGQIGELLDQYGADQLMTATTNGETQ